MEGGKLTAIAFSTTRGVLEGSWFRSLYERPAATVTAAQVSGERLLCYSWPGSCSPLKAGLYLRTGQAKSFTDACFLFL